MLAGHSGTPLLKKLGIKPGFRLWLVNAPVEYTDWLGPLPDGVQVVSGRAEPQPVNCDFIHFFTTSRDDLAARLPQLKAALAKAWFISAKTIFTNLCHSFDKLRTRSEVLRSIPLNEAVEILRSEDYAQNDPLKAKFVKDIFVFLNHAWFDNQAEAAVNFYVSIFDDATIVSINRYEGGPMEGKVLTAVFQLNDQEFMALDGGPEFNFTEAVSFFVHCESQEEVDHYWEKLAEGGDEKAQQCGWLKDKYGVSWQIIPTALPELLNHPDPEKAQKVMQAMLQMKKIDVQGLRQV